eukprot:9482636-Lingulodinium_polyedra.AAC.1
MARIGAFDGVREPGLVIPACSRARSRSRSTTPEPVRSSPRKRLLQKTSIPGSVTRRRSDVRGECMGVHGFTFRRMQ